MVLERDRKLVEAQVKDLHARLDEAENNALKVMNYLNLCILLVLKNLHVNSNSVFDFSFFPIKKKFSFFRFIAQQHQKQLQASLSCAIIE